MTHPYKNTKNLPYLSKENLEEKLKIALLKTDQPSSFFKALRQTDQLNIWFPELSALKQTLSYAKSLIKV